MCIRNCVFSDKLFTRVSFTFRWPPDTCYLPVSIGTQNHMKKMKVWLCEHYSYHVSINRDIWPVSNMWYCGTATDSGAEDIMYKLLPRGPRIRNEEVITFIFVAINLLDYLHGKRLIFHKQTLPQVILNLMCLSLYWNADFLSFSRSCIRRISAYLLLCGSFSSFCISLRFIALNCLSVYNTFTFSEPPSALLTFWLEAINFWVQTYTSTCSTAYWILNLLQVLIVWNVNYTVCVFSPIFTHLFLLRVDIGGISFFIFKNICFLLFRSLLL